MQHTHNGRLLAIAAGTAFTYGSLIILMGDRLTKPNEWTDYNILTILTVFGVIAAGHQIGTAWKDRHKLAAFGYVLVFVVGTGLVVHNSLGRQAEASDTQTLSVEAANAAIASKSTDLAKAKLRFDDANKWADKEMSGERCGQRCKDWRLRATEVGAHIKALEAEIAALGPAKPVNAKADKMAAIAALFGADKAKAMAMVMLLEPLLWTVFFELGAIVSLGFAFRHGPRVVTANDNRPTAEVEPLPPATAIPTARKGENVIEWKRRFQAENGRPPRLDEAQAAFEGQDISRSTIYRRLKAA